MWKPNQDEPRRVPGAQPNITSPTNFGGAAARVGSATEQPTRAEAARTVSANLTKAVVIRGELSGSEDLYFDGTIEGSITLNANTLTVGPNARVKANVEAAQVVVLGNITGNITAKKVELRNSAQVVGDIRTGRINIDDGAYFKGGIDIQREG